MVCDLWDYWNQESQTDLHDLHLKICTNHNALKASEKSRTYIPGDLEVASFEEEVCPIFATCSSCESLVVCVSTCTGGKVMRSYDCYWWCMGDISV